MKKCDCNSMFAQEGCIAKPEIAFPGACPVNGRHSEAPLKTSWGPSNVNTVKKITPEQQALKGNDLPADRVANKKIVTVKKNNRIKLKLLSLEKRKEDTLSKKGPEYERIKKLDLNNIEKAATVITEAFMDYPLPGQYISDIDRRRIALREIFKVELRKALKKDAVYTLGGDFQEVAIWKNEVVPKSNLAYIKHMRLDTLKLLLTIRLKEYIKLFRALRNILDAKKKLYLPGNTVELYIVGVNPANQGQGRLSKLLKPVLKAMQEQEQPVLVMTNTKSNKKIYEHLGFKLIKVLDDQDNVITAYYLVKYP